MISANQIKELENAINYAFNNKSLLIEALSHPSLKQRQSKTPIKNYERLELLGDAILNFIITELLFKRHATGSESKLAKIRACLVGRDSICAVASEFDLSKYIIMTLGEEHGGGRNNPNNIENTMEALIAAIYLDSNIETITQIVKNWWGSFLVTDNDINDPKSELQEWSQSNGGDKPIYTVIQREGPSHCSTFTVIVKVQIYQATGQGSSIKAAQKQAAQKLLEEINKTY